LTPTREASRQERKLANQALNKIVGACRHLRHAVGRSRAKSHDTEPDGHDHLPIRDRQPAACRWPKGRSVCLGSGAVRMRLGAGFSFADPFPERPPRMHWRTYQCEPASEGAPRCRSPSVIAAGALHGPFRRSCGAARCQVASPSRARTRAPSPPPWEGLVSYASFPASNAAQLTKIARVNPPVQLSAMVLAPTVIWHSPVPGMENVFPVP
jgi:hypothetical protein